MKTRLVVALGVAALAAGCGGGSSGGSQTGPLNPTPPPHHHHHHSSTPTPTSPPTSPSPTVTVTQTSAPAVATCESKHLTLSLGQSQGTAGSSYQPIVFTNKGSSVCTLRGYPGVSYVDSSGAILGKPASEEGGHRVTVTLQPGDMAHATLQQPDPGNFSPSSCNETTADRLQVYPPGETKQLFVTDHVQVCTSKQARSSVYTVQSGAS